MEPKQYEELGSFPDLLLDRSQQKPERLKNFSHAVYRHRQLSNRYGDFNYPFFLPDSSTLVHTNTLYTHYFFYPDEDTTVIISQEKRELNYFFTFNSYLLLFFALMIFCSYLLYSWGFARQYSSPTLTRRIQTIIILLLILAMTAVGITSGRLVTRQFERNNQKQLEEKTEIIINELSDQFKPQQLFDESQKELVNLKLKEYARLFNTPISLFHKDGNLYNTSEPKLYELGLAAQLMNPKAFAQMSSNRSSSESVNARAGTLKYTSLYTPLFNEKKELSGFLNLPYFARQNDLANELSGIISALINVYVILFVISILSGLILSGFITQPLRIIKQQLANITLGKQNEKIVWQSNDEIGKLVSEYNQMLVKLEESAGLLAQSERESAWREMAKQVAHEIKNPLTPMKLNLQYLQHLMKQNPEDFKEKFAQASAGIIEQIDSLAAIASEFSNFAKLPAANLQDVNLVEIIKTSSLIFQNEKNIAITNHINATELLVKGDRDQCLRVFNNIFKNAIQALDEVNKPQIDVYCEIKDKTIVVCVKDNGCGIDEIQKPKIFTPNFTTKNTGSGLGLAMVKNILQGFGGTIWFESQKNLGTSFYLEFRKA
ncbi:MAG: HAMP domain-containing histidine kinase [Bacteroidia bacterium]|nr:HAMP domain-containing histidine kinase [Bacteroidia bacterium]